MGILERIGSWRMWIRFVNDYVWMANPLVLLPGALFPYLEYGAYDRSTLAPHTARRFMIRPDVTPPDCINPFSTINCEFPYFRSMRNRRIGHLPCDGRCSLPPFGLLECLLAIMQANTRYANLFYPNRALSLIPNFCFSAASLSTIELRASTR